MILRVKLWGAVEFGGNGAPIVDIFKTVQGGDKVVIFGEIAGVFIEIIGHIGLINTDSGDIIDPIIEESFVFVGAKFTVHGTTSREDDVVYQSVTIIREIKTVL